MKYDKDAGIVKGSFKDCDCLSHHQHGNRGQKGCPICNPIPDKITEVLEGIYEAGQYHKRAKSNAEYKQKDITQARQQIIDCVPPRRKIVSDDGSWYERENIGFNLCRNQTLKNMGVE